MLLFSLSLTFLEKKFNKISNLTGMEGWMILAGDIGGTRTRLALFDTSDGFKCVKQERYASRDFPNLSSILLLFSPEGAEKVCLGIAGPVRHGRVHATNLPWLIDARELGRELKTDAVWLINDLEANAYGLRRLSPDQFLTLNTGDPEAAGNAALISVGTGLGEAGLYWDGHIHRPFASEGGHTNFGPRDELEAELWRYLRKQFDHVSYERVLSGNGLFRIYRFLIDMRLEEEPEWIHQEMLQDDPAKVITDKALRKENKACQRALEWFVSIYGSEAGNLALKYLALGGVYVGGGVAPKILPALQQETFMKAFTAKGRFAELLSSIPVKVVLEENTALLGAAEYAHKK